jgi:hypothetical protein
MNRRVSEATYLKRKSQDGLSGRTDSAAFTDRPLRLQVLDRGHTFLIICFFIPYIRNLLKTPAVKRKVFDYTHTYGPRKTMQLTLQSI